MDILSLSLANFAVLVVVTVLAVLEAVGRRETHLNLWAAGLVLTTVGFFLVFLGLSTPTVLVLLVGNILVLSYNMTLNLGFRAYLGLTPLVPRRFVVWVFLWLVGMLWFTFFWPHYGVRVLVSGLFQIILMVEMAAQSWHSRSQIPRRILALMLLAASLYAGLNVARVLTSWTNQAQSLSTDASTTPVTLLVIMVSLILWSGCFLLLDSYRLNNAVKNSALELERLNRLKDRVMAMTSHDLRGPLGNLQLLWSDLADRLRRKDYASIDEDLFAMVDRSLAGNQSLLENLFSFAESQRSAPRGEVTADLAQAVAEVYAQWDSTARTKNVQLELEFPESILVAAEPTAVVAVLRNLVGNAVKFTPSGGRVTVKALASPPRLEVSDTGLGMEPDLLEKVFRMSGKVSRRGTAGEQGSGFGLVLVKELVSGWGGSLEVDSQVGKGTLVTVTFSHPPR